LTNPGNNRWLLAFNNGSMTGIGNASSIGAGSTFVNATNNSTAIDANAAGTGNTELVADGNAQAETKDDGSNAALSKVKTGTASSGSLSVSETSGRSFTTTVQKSTVHTIGNGTRAQSKGVGYGSAQTATSTGTTTDGTAMSADVGSFADGQGGGRLSVNGASGPDGAYAQSVGIGGGDSWAKIFGILRDGKIPGN
jgi:hypothetical protein